MKINCWVAEFLRYLESKPTNINFPSIDEQLVERSGELKVLQNRIDYLSIHGKMTVAVIGIVAEKTLLRRNKHVKPMKPIRLIQALSNSRPSENRVGLYLPTRCL
jgi:hypothetical protein